MSVLLILLMSTNLLAGLLIMPALIAWTRPRFITRYEVGNPAARRPGEKAGTTFATS